MNGILLAGHRTTVEDFLSSQWAQSKAILPEVHVPTMIIHSREDDFHSLRSVDLLERQLGSSVKEKLILDNSYHVVTMDYQKATVAAEVTRFFQRFVGNSFVAL